VSGYRKTGTTFTLNVIVALVIKLLLDASIVYVVIGEILAYNVFPKIVPFVELIVIPIGGVGVML
jgi:hypothetical protein